MSFCRFSSESIISNATSVDNIFINEFLPYATDNDVKVYLFGLYKCTTPNMYDNTLASFSSILGLSEDEIRASYSYWQEQGLVQIIETDPFEVVYNPIRNAITNTKKYNKDKYATFNAQLEAEFKGREIRLNEYYQFYEFMETYHFEPEALVMIIRHCIEAKGLNVGYRYILAIAKNWANEGISSYEKVEEKLIELEQKNTEIGEIFALLGIKRSATLDEKEMLNKWENELGFSFETIVGIIKNNKKRKKNIKNFEKLDSYFKKYYEAKLTSLKEIESYEEEIECINSLSRLICKDLGLYYENIEPVSNTYTRKWLLMGFGDGVLESIANYCFKLSIRSLDGMDTTINKLFKLGVVSQEALDEYLNGLVSADKQIRDILEKLGIVRNVNKFDRELYKTWTEDWQIPNELLFEAIKLSSDKVSPMQYLNKVLSKWHSEGVKTVEESKKFNIEPFATQKASTHNFSDKHNYSQKDLSALFDNLEEIEL